MFFDKILHILIMTYVMNILQYGNNVNIIVVFFMAMAVTQKLTLLFLLMLLLQHHQ